MKPNLSSNYNLGLGRLKSLLKTFKYDEGLRENYDGIIEVQMKTGIIENV